MEKPVSVVLPVFNGLPYLREQLQSILVQLEANDELLIVDDCSTDGSLEYLRFIQANTGLDIKIYENSVNKGLLYNIRKLIISAKSDIIIFSDQDDIWCSKKIKLIKKAFLNEEIALVVHDAQYICENSRDPLNNTTAFKHLRTSSNFAKNFIRNGFIGCCMAINRSKYPRKAIYNVPYTPMHDWYLSCFALMYGKHIKILRESLISHRRHTGAFTRQNIAFLEKLLQRYKLFRMLIK